MSEKFSAGDEASATDANRMFRGTNLDSIKAGETINGATLPVPVYQSAADNELYKCDANVTTKLNFIGFAVSNSTDGNAINFQGDGIVKGFTGLTEGTRYYVQDTAGTIGTTPGTYRVLVGQAISQTELLIKKERRYRSFSSSRLTNTAAGSTSYAHGLGIIPRIVKITALGDTIGEISLYSCGVWSDGAYNTIYMQIGGAATGLALVTTSYIVYIAGETGTDYCRATITVDATNITLAWTQVDFAVDKNIRLLFEVWED